VLKYAFAVFLSAFLLFQIQPIIAKIILPWFGGASSVWTICLVFFQVFLLIGYLYAHLLTKLRTVQLQAAVHAVLVIGATIGFLPIEASLSGMPQSDSSPQAGIIFLLLTTIGLPYALISSSGPLFQSWFQNTFPSGDTYRLYALSNVGSLLGLLSYPLLVEPSLDLRWQTSLWSAGFVAYSIVCLIFTCRGCFRFGVHHGSIVMGWAGGDSFNFIAIDYQPNHSRHRVCPFFVDTAAITLSYILHHLF